MHTLGGRIVDLGDVYGFSLELVRVEIEAIDVKLII